MFTLVLCEPPFLVQPYYSVDVGAIPCEYCQYSALPLLIYSQGAKHATELIKSAAFNPWRLEGDRDDILLEIRRIAWLDKVGDQCQRLVQVKHHELYRLAPGVAATASLDAMQSQGGGWICPLVRTVLKSVLHLR